MKRKEILMKMSLFASKLENCFHHFILGFAFSIVLNQRLWIIHKWPMVCDDKLFIPLKFKIFLELERSKNNLH